MCFIYIIWILCALILLVSTILWLKIGTQKFIQFVESKNESIKISFAVIAAIYAAAQYQIEVTNKKVEASLEFSKKLESDPLRSSYEYLNKLWITGDGYDTLIKYRKDEITNDDWANKAKDLIENDNAELHIMNLHGLYRDVIICVQRNRCDEKTACQIFAREVENFRLTYRKFLTKWEEAFKSDVKNSLKNFYHDCNVSEYL